MITKRVKDNLDLVDSLTIDYMIELTGYIYEDLVGAAFVGLILANTQVYDESDDFKTHAENWIKKALDHFVEHGDLKDLV